MREIARDALEKADANNKKFELRIAELRAKKEAEILRQSIKVKEVIIPQPQQSVSINAKNIDYYFMARYKHLYSLFTPFFDTKCDEIREVQKAFEALLKAVEAFDKVKHRYE